MMNIRLARQLNRIDVNTKRNHEAMQQISPISAKCWVRIFGVALLSLLITACEPSNTSMNAANGHGHDEMAEEAPHGPHGGRLLMDGDFAVEMGIDEAGRPPRWQIYAYWQQQMIPANELDVTVGLTRLDGEKQTFPLVAEFDALVSNDIVTEPHSFDVDVAASYQGREYRWTYPSYEGRTEINTEVAQAMGLSVEPVGSATIEETLDILGRIDFAPNALVTLRAQFPGRVVKVLKQEGDRVKKNEVMAVVEASDSLRQYNIKATMDGMVIRRGTNVGDVVNDAALFSIGDLSQLRVAFHVYPGDFSRIRPGQPVMISSVDETLQAESVISAYLPTTEAATQTIIAYSPLENNDELWLPGMTVKGAVTINNEVVPLAVKTDAIQRFREWPVVFAKVGDTYEARMLEVGLQTEEWTEVLAGIKPGQDYVTGNSYLIKADIEKDGASHDH